jgi:hypothetical protein
MKSQVPFRSAAVGLLILLWMVLACNAPGFRTPTPVLPTKPPKASATPLPLKKTEKPSLKATAPGAQKNSPSQVSPSPGEGVFPTLEGTRIVKTTFQGNRDCPCGDYSVARATGDEGFLTCDYSFQDPTGGSNQMSFSIQQQNTVELVKKSFQNSLSSTRKRAQPRESRDTLKTIRDDDTGFIFVLLEPNPGNQKAPLCGEGEGLFIVRDAYEVDFRLQSCDLAQDEAGYVTAMNSLQTCSENAIQSAAK